MLEGQDDQSHEVTGTAIVIDERPLCFWDRDDPRAQVQCLDNIDPTYFQYLARIHHSQLEGDDSVRAAVALRVTYSHALESLFALVGAAIQAPHCPAGWLLKYQNTDLKGFIGKIAERKPFYNKWGLEMAGWSEIANTLLPWSMPDNDGAELRDASAKLWKSLARDVLDASFDDEYNSIKHGFRVRSGDWYFALGREDIPGTPAPPERMQMMASSRFGSTFLRAKSLKKYHWAFEEQRVNWNPAVFARRLPLIADSIQNVLTFLRYVNGTPAEELEVSVVNHAAVSEALLNADHSSSVRFSVGLRITSEELPSPSREDILNRYLQKLESSGES